MDDCNLSKLTVKPGSLTPTFNKDITEYNVTVASNVEKITLNPTTSDNGASFSISVDFSVLNFIRPIDLNFMNIEILEFRSRFLNLRSRSLYTDTKLISNLSLYKIYKPYLDLELDLHRNKVLSLDLNRTQGLKVVL